MSKIPVYRHKDGTPYVRPYLGTNAVTKKAIRPYKQFPKGLTDEEVQPLAQEWLSGFTPAAKYHVTDRLSDVLYRYIDILEANKKSPNTIKTYRSNVRCYIDPHIPNIRAGELKPYQVDALYNVLLMQGGRKGEGISPSKVINLHWMLAGAYKWFVTQGISEYNPIVSATPPEAPLYEAVAYNEQEFQMLSRALSEALREPADSPEAIFRKNAMFAAYLALNTGERCGELCANSKEDAQLARMMMHIGYTAVEEKGKGRLPQAEAQGQEDPQHNLARKRVREHKRLLRMAEKLPHARQGRILEADDMHRLQRRHTAPLEGLGSIQGHARPRGSSEEHKLPYAQAHARDMAPSGRHEPEGHRRQAGARQGIHDARDIRPPHARPRPHGR